jgi:hypothetical protein
MSARTKLFLACLAAALAIGCGAKSRKPADADFSVNNNSSVVVMGVSPVARLRAYQGWVDGKQWEQAQLAEAKINALPESGYIVAAIEPSLKGDSYGIMRVIPAVMNVLSVCTGGSTAFFEVPPNSVVYIGDFHLATEPEYEVEVGYEFDKALAFMKATYPELAKKLSKGKAKVAKVTNGQCDGKPVSFVGK